MAKLQPCLPCSRSELSRSRSHLQYMESWCLRRKSLRCIEHISCHTCQHHEVALPSINRRRTPLAKAKRAEIECRLPRFWKLELSRLRQKHRPRKAADLALVIESLFNRASDVQLLTTEGPESYEKLEARAGRAASFHYKEANSPLVQPWSLTLDPFFLRGLVRLSFNYSDNLHQPAIPWAAL